MSLDYRSIANSSFSSLAAYAGTGGPGSLAIAGFTTGPVGAAVGAAIAGISLAASMIGRGRREADIIVPLQNQYAGVLDAVNATLRMDPNLTYEQLRSLQQLVAGGYQEFEQFTRDPRFTDGRASVGARNTIRPYVDGRNDNGDIVDPTGGALGKIALRMGNGAGALAAAAGLPRPMLLAGAVLAAKLLKFF